MNTDFQGRHFEGEIILGAVRWYCRYGISYRELQEMLTERGIPVDHTTLYRWVQRYAPEIEKRALLQSFSQGVKRVATYLFRLQQT